MKLKDIINYLEATDSCVITTVDVKTGEDVDQWEGSILTIPWYFIEYYLYNDSVNYEAISIGHKDGKTYFDITLCEPENPFFK